MSKLQPMYPAVINSIGTSLSGAISASQTKLYVQDVTRIPYPPNLLVIGEDYPTAETVKLISISGDGSIIVERGFQGIARDWEADTTIARNHTAYDHDSKKENIEALQRATTIPNLIYTTKEGINTFSINPYSIYYIEDDYKIQYDSPDHERHYITLLKVFENEKDRENYKNPIRDYFYLVKESNEIWWYDFIGWHTVSMNDLLFNTTTLEEVQVVLGLTHDEALDEIILAKKGNMFITEDTKQLIVDMVTGHHVLNLSSPNRICMTSNETYEIFETEAEKIAFDVSDITKQYGCYVKETNKFWYWLPNLNTWERISQTQMFDQVTKQWAEQLESEN